MTKEIGKCVIGRIRKDNTYRMSYWPASPKALKTIYKAALIHPLITKEDLVFQARDAKTIKEAFIGAFILKCLEELNDKSRQKTKRKRQKTI